MKYLYKLKLKDVITLLVAVIIGFVWLRVDQLFLLRVYQRFIALFILLMVLIYFQIKINKPDPVIKYANTLSLILVTFCIIVSLVMHVITHHDFSYKSVLIWITVAIMPYIVGFLFKANGKQVKN